MTEHTLTTVEFHGATLFAVKRSDGVFVPITPICNDLGIDPKKQRERAQRDPILAEGGAVVALPSPGGAQETFCLRLDLVHGWLFTIDESRVKDAPTRQRVLLYKRECYRVLFEHFFGQARAAVEPKEGEIVDKEDLTTLPIQTKISLTNLYCRVWGQPAAQEMCEYLKMPVMPSMVLPARQPRLDLGEIVAFRPKQWRPMGEGA